MNKTFDIKRIGMVIRWDIMTLWKFYLGAIIGCVIAFSLYSLNMLYSDNSIDDTSSADSYLIHESIFFGFMIFTAFNVMATCIFTNMKTKNSRESFLMLPASNLEKYVARLLIMSIGCIIELAIILFATDVIQLAFSYIINSAFHTSITLHILKDILDFLINALFGSENFITISSAIFGHSFCTLGGTFYRKMAPLLTFVTAIVLFMVFGYITYCMGQFGDFFQSNIIATAVITILFLALSAFNYWASYKIFCRMQVISNKWINI